MISFNDIQDILAGTFFDGNMELAGIAIFLVAIIGILGITRNPFYALLTGMGVTLMFSVMGILSTEVTVLMIVVSVLGLAYTSRNIWGDR